MRIPCVQGSMTAKVNNVLSKSGKKSGKEIAKEKEAILEMARLKSEQPKPYHAMPELNFLGLWKWF